MIEKLCYLLFLMCISFWCSASENDVDAKNIYKYTATFISTSPLLKDSISTISFEGKKIFSSGSSVVNELESCEHSKSLLLVSSSYRWLDFKIDLKKGHFSTEGIDNQKLSFNYPTSILGNEVRVMGANLVSEGTTVIYLSQSKGILGFGLLGNYAGMGDRYYPPIYWLEGDQGLCHTESDK